MASVNQETCIGCGVCEVICPDGYYLVDRKAQIKDDKKASASIESEETCPVDAISLK